MLIQDQSLHSCQWLSIPPHSGWRQPLASVPFPWQEPWYVLLWSSQALALILAPLPHVVEHTDHSLHGLHRHFFRRQSLVSVNSPGQEPWSGELQARALIWDPLPHFVEQSDHSLHSCHSIGHTHVPHSRWRQSLYFASVYTPDRLFLLHLVETHSLKLRISSCLLPFFIFAFMPFGHLFGHILDNPPCWTSLANFFCQYCDCWLLPYLAVQQAFQLHSLSVNV